MPTSKTKTNNEKKKKSDVKPLSIFERMGKIWFFSLER